VGQGAEAGFGGPHLLLPHAQQPGRLELGKPKEFPQGRQQALGRHVDVFRHQNQR
jgi:hypothetical protein